MQLIRVSEMLATMDMKDEGGMPIPFDMRVITCNQKAGTGGRRMICKNVIMLGGTTAASARRDQNKYGNYTRNFRSVNNDEVRQFHPLLVEEFNGMKVIL